MKKSNQQLENGCASRYLSKLDREVAHPIRVLPLGLNLEEKLERVEMICEQVRVYRIWKVARQSVPEENREFFDEEVERMEAWFQNVL